MMGQRSTASVPPSQTNGDHSSVGCNGLAAVAVVPVPTLLLVQKGWGSQKQLPILRMELEGKGGGWCGTHGREQWDKLVVVQCP